jgi:hypothetical protein
MKSIMTTYIITYVFKCGIVVTSEGWGSNEEWPIICYGQNKSIFFLNSDYDHVHAKHICKMCIRKLSIVHNLLFSVICDSETK